MERFARSLRALVALAVCGSMMGCGGYGAICADEMDCRRGNEADVDACVVDHEYWEDRSALDGCDVQWDEYYACYEAESRCRRVAGNDVFGPEGYCDREALDWLDCIDFNP